MLPRCFSTALSIACRFPLVCGLAAILVVALAPLPLNAQVCDEWILSTQADVDTFNCSSTTSHLYITGPDITNLDGLSELVSVGGNLTLNLNPLLTNIHGLSSLTSVAGALSLTFNTSLPNLDALSSLTSVGGVLLMTDNTALDSCCGLFPLLNGSGPAGGILLITANGSGCNSAQEIIAGGMCKNVAVDEQTWSVTKVLYR